MATILMGRAEKRAWRFLYAELSGDYDSAA